LGDALTLQALFAENTLVSTEVQKSRKGKERKTKERNTTPAIVTTSDYMNGGVDFHPLRQWFEPEEFE
jgi:hypothetical protein